MNLIILKPKRSRAWSKYINAALISTLAYMGAKLLIIDLLAVYTYTNVM